MEGMHVLLPDDTRLELPEGATGADAAAAIGAGLARAALAVKVDGVERDLVAPLHDGARLEIVTPSSPDALDLLRHDTAHVLAAAVIDLYPEVRISIGPPIENGFYYDFEFPPGVTISDADFDRIEAKMREHVKADEHFRREDVTVAAALERFREQEQPYKVELIEDLVKNAPADDPVETVSLYTNGPFTDLCRGPHGPGTKRIRAFKLQSVAGAYWRGDATRTMLTRIYGTAFFSRDDLKAYLEQVEEARARDHRRLGRELELFQFSPVAPGSAFWLPNGTIVYNLLVELAREMNRPRGYTEVRTPMLYDSELWRTSGHWDKYRENMFISHVEDRDMALKPMNCPGHAHLYSLQRHSYRDLPVRYAEPGPLHRYEPSGTLHGLLRVRQFVQDDAHIFCREDQIQDEVNGCLELVFATLRRFGFEIDVELSTRPEQRIGSGELWDRAEGALIEALEGQEIAYRVNPGDGAFYGPKIDFHVTDSLGRSWQLGTVQLDYNMPERFGLVYTGADNAEHTPVMIHRAAFGSFERFIGILIEHYAGEFPLWLAPVQATLLPISDRHVPYANEIAATLRDEGVRVDVDERTESIGRKIRDAELRKVHYMLVVGDREQETGSVGLRQHREGDLGSLTVGGFAERVRDEIEQRSA